MADGAESAAHSPTRITQRAPHGPAGMPFIVVNTLAGGFCTYGLVGLRPGLTTMATFSVLLILNSLCGIQVRGRACLP